VPVPVHVPGRQVLTAFVEGSLAVEGFLYIVIIGLSTPFGSPVFLNKVKTDFPLTRLR